MLFLAEYMHKYLKQKKKKNISAHEMRRMGKGPFKGPTRISLPASSPRLPHAATSPLRRRKKRTALLCLLLSARPSSASGQPLSATRGWPRRERAHARPPPLLAAAPPRRRPSWSSRPPPPPPLELADPALAAAHWISRPPALEQGKEELSDLTATSAHLGVRLPP